MEAKARLGITRDFFSAAGELLIPGPGLKLLDEISALEYQMLDEFLPEVSAAQARDFDMVISGAARWSARSLADNERLVAVLFTGVGYDLSLIHI